MICIDCSWSRFPDPKAQCYKTGGLICSLLSFNVGKFDACLLDNAIGEEKLKRLGRDVLTLRIRRDEQSRVR